MAEILRQLWDFEIVPMSARLMPLLGPACETSNGRWTAWDALSQAMERKIQIWVAEAGGAVFGVAITSIIEYPRARACKLHVGTAEHSTPAMWRSAIAQIMAWAKARGCALFEMEARPGWERIFAGTLKKSHVFLEVNLA